MHERSLHHSQSSHRRHSSLHIYLSQHRSNHVESSYLLQHHHPHIIIPMQPYSVVCDMSSMGAFGSLGGGLLPPGGEYVVNLSRVWGPIYHHSGWVDGQSNVSGVTAATLLFLFTCLFFTSLVQPFLISRIHRCPCIEDRYITVNHRTPCRSHYPSFRHPCPDLP